MIEGLIRNTLLAVPEITEYTSKIFRISAPEGTTTPYIVINADDQPDESDVLALFEIDINIYDNREDRTFIKNISKKIKDTLHYEEFEEFGDYENIRIYFQNKNTVKENRSTLVSTSLSFTARATEKYQ